MLRIAGAPAPLTLGMMPLDPESQHPDRERQPLVRVSQQSGLLLEHIGSMHGPPSLN